MSTNRATKPVKRQCRTGFVSPARQGRPKGGGKLEPVEASPVEPVEAPSDVTMPDLAETLQVEHGVRATPAMLSRSLCERRFTY